MSHRFDERFLTVAREVNRDGVRRYLVWFSKDNLSTFVKAFEAVDVADAKAQAIRELEWYEDSLFRL